MTFAPNDRVWNLTLDQIASGTGAIVHRQETSMSEAGSSTFIFDEQTVLYSKLRPYLNKVIWPRDRGVATTELVPLKPDEDLMLPGYLTHYLRSSVFLNFISSRVAGAKMPRVVMDEFWAHEIPHPKDRREQVRIVDLLDQADALRRQRAAADAKLARLLPAIFRHYFGDLQTNERGYGVRPFDFIVRDTKNGLYKPADHYGQGTRILKMFNIQAGGWDLDRVDQVELSPGEILSYRLEEGDLLLNRVNSPELVGKCAVVTAELAGAVFESKNIRVRVRPEAVTPEFVWYYLNSECGRAALTQGMKHAIGMATINGSDLRSLRIPSPPIEQQRQWTRMCNSLRGLQDHAAASVAKLETLFQTLLHRAFTGELTARWREAHLREGVEEMARVARA